MNNNEIVKKTIDEIQTKKYENHICENCGRKIKYIENKFTGNMLPCKCQCEVEKEEKEKLKVLEEERQKLVMIAKKECFNHKSMWENTFENDNGLNSKMCIARDYVDKWEAMLELNGGLMLIGNVGTGKSYMACAIANALIEKGVKVKMTSFIEITNNIFNASDKVEYVKRLNEYDLLIIDDVGAERNSEYTLENVYWVIDERMNAKKPIIITTNSNLDRQECDKNIYRKRINERLRFVCVPVEMPEDNIREKLARKHNKDAVAALSEGGDLDGD